MVKPQRQHGEWVRCFTAPNPGPMTGPGTNTWVLGKGPFVVIDPGPNHSEHLESVYLACHQQIALIVLTHTHRDHAAGAAALRELSGAPVLGMTLTPDDGHQELSALPLLPVSKLSDFEVPGVSLNAVPIPGHVANHLCFYHQESQMMFVGDHMMNGSTVVIIPPAGHMGSYMTSLASLLRYPMRAIGPGHGDVITEPKIEIERLINHRLTRERKVLGALSEQWSTLDQILGRVYDDIDPVLLPIAKLSLEAHLIKLCEDGKTRKQDGEHWLLGSDTWRLN
ncbi:MAG: MBL fold metallo-hydrolase [Pseudomonadales bacterium]